MDVKEINMEREKINLVYLNTDDNYIKEYKNKFKEFKVNALNVEELNKDLDISEDNKLIVEYIKFKYLYENAGLLLDGNFEFIDNLSLFFLHDVCMAYSDVENISSNFIFVKNKGNDYIKKILDLIKTGEYDNITDILSKVLDRDLRHNFNSIVSYNKEFYIYPYEYFFPIDYENVGKDFTDNVKAIYYKKGVKLSRRIKNKINMVKRLSPLSYKYFITMLRALRNNIGYRKYLLQQNIKKRFSVKQDIDIDKTLEVLDKYTVENKKAKENGEKLPHEYIIIHHPKWLGVTSATKELFTNLVPLQEVYLDSNINAIAEKIINSGVNQVIFSAFDYGWDKIATKVRALNKEIKLKSFWHGSHSQVIEKINWETNVMVIELHKKGIIDVMGTCKESMFNFYKSQGYNAAFIQNTVRFTDDIKEELSKVEKNNDGTTLVGLYSAGMDWRKNTYTQLMATSLIDNAVLELVPLRYELEVIAAKNNLKTTGKYEHIKREELLLKMARNNINIYVTFSECAPMLPIESLEAGTICLTGNNHHYFNNTKLYDYLVVEREDDVMAIYEKMKYAIAHKDEIMELYKKWKLEYDKISKKSVDSFLEM